MRRWLDGERGRKYVGVAELAQASARIIAESGAAQQARGTVTELPDERTVRYYLSEGLVSPADEKQGTASVFGYRHLLQLLSVKKLQADHLPIRAIRELVSGKTERQLERLLGADNEGGASAPAKGEAVKYLESLLKRPPAPAPAVLPAAQQQPPARMTGPQAPLSAAPPVTWSRIELEPGLEVHVSDGYRPPQGEGALRRLSQSFLNILKALGAQTPGRGGR